MARLSIAFSIYIPGVGLGTVRGGKRLRLTLPPYTPSDFKDRALSPDLTDHVCFQFDGLALCAFATDASIDYSNRHAPIVDT
jgi:hypothetical protein